MPKLKPEEVEHRRQEIIEAARRCFLRNGFHQTTTDEICHEAAITPGGLYHYFDSKEAIISAVIEDAARSAVRLLSSELKLVHYFNRPNYPQGNGRIERSFRTDDRATTLLRVKQSRAPASWTQGGLSRGSGATGQ